MKQNKLSIDVVIPTHNRSFFLKEAIESALNQTYIKTKIIVVSDGFDHDTDILIENHYKENKLIRYFTYEIPKGANYARNFGVQQSDADLIAFLDDDDVWDKDKLEQQVDCFENKNIGLCVTAIRAFRPNSKKTIYFYPKKVKKGKTEILVKNLLGSTTTAVVRRNLFQKVKGFDEKLPALQDYDLWIRLLQITDYEVVNIPKVTYNIMHDPNAISRFTDRYIVAYKLLDIKYKSLIKEINLIKRKVRTMTKFNYLAKRSIMNDDLKTTIKFSLLSFITLPNILSMELIVLCFIPRRIRNKIIK